MGFFVYVIYNKDRTADIEKRLKRHNGELKNKYSSFTKRNDGEWVLMYAEEYGTRAESMRREKQLKTSRGRSFIKCLLGK